MGRGENRNHCYKSRLPCQSVQKYEMESDLFLLKLLLIKATSISNRDEILNKELPVGHGHKNGLIEIESFWSRKLNLL